MQIRVVLPLLYVLLATTEIITQNQPTIKRSPIEFYYYSSVTPKDITDPEGKEFKNSGQYILSNNVNVKESPNSTGVSIGEKIKTDGIISITESNVVLDLNKKYISSNIKENNPTAIYIADHVRNVTIKNGFIFSESKTAGFNTAIHVGSNTSNITIENVTIRGALGINGAIKIEGTNSNDVINVTLKDVIIYNCHHNKNSAIISASYAQNIYLENINIYNNETSDSGSLSAIKINNSHEVKIYESFIKNNNSSDNNISIEINECSNIDLKNNLMFNNKGSLGSQCLGIQVNDSNNICISEVTIDNAINAYAGIFINRSSDVTIKQSIIEDCKNESGSFAGLLLKGLDNARINNVKVTRNNVVGDFIGISSEDTDDTIECNNIEYENVSITYNQSSEGKVNGISIKGAQETTILDSVISHNKSIDPNGKTVNGIYIASHTKNSKELYITNCKILHNSAHPEATNKGNHVAGIYLQGVHECEIIDTKSNFNKGNGQAFGYYAEWTPELLINNSEAVGNCAGVSPSGLDQLPSAGLYLWKCNDASIKNSRFNDNKAGNRNDGAITGATGSGIAKNTINAISSCGGHGILNVGISPSSPNKHNSFINCICQNNGTQIINLPDNNLDPLLPPQYQGIDQQRRCWESEAMASGATEQNTLESSYVRCKFTNNGLHQHVPSYGLCIANSDAFSVCKELEVINCESKNNGFYGFYDEQSITLTAHIIGCMSTTNGTVNEIARAVERDEHILNYKVVKTNSIPYINIATIDRVLLDPQKIDLINFSISD